jgi:hypothetical protein
VIGFTDLLALPVWNTKMAGGQSCLVNWAVVASVFIPILQNFHECGTLASPTIKLFVLVS